VLDASFSRRNHAPARLQLGVLVPLLLRTMRAPKLSTARAAIQTFKDLFATPALVEPLLALVADDSSPTSSAVLALMQKATGGGPALAGCLETATAG